MSGTGQVIGGAGSSIVAGAVVLPNTGGNMSVALAISLAAGLLTWGVMYAHANR